MYQKNLFFRVCWMTVILCLGTLHATHTKDLNIRTKQPILLTSLSQEEQEKVNTSSTNCCSKNCLPNITLNCCKWYNNRQIDKEIEKKLKEQEQERIANLEAIVVELVTKVDRISLLLPSMQNRQLNKKPHHLPTHSVPFLRNDSSLIQNVEKGQDSIVVTSEHSHTKAFGLDQVRIVIKNPFLPPQPTPSPISLIQEQESDDSKKNPSLNKDMITPIPPLQDNKIQLFVPEN